jgi:DNA-binding transcriptional LysR family regulator
MELRQLKYFIAVAEHLSFSKAALRLHVTVPPLSRQIRQLEEELDVELFARDRRKVALTDAGQLLLREARALVAQTTHALDCVRLAKKGEAGLVRVGIGFGLGERVSRVILQHSEQFPGVGVRCTEIYSSLQDEALREGRIDVGFLRPPVDSDHLESELLFEEGFTVHLSRDNALAKRKFLRIKDLAGEPLLIPERTISAGLYDKTLEMYARAGVTPHVVQVPMDPSPHGDLQTVLLACRRGIFIVPDEIACCPPAGGEVVAVPLDEPEAKVGVYAAWRKSEKSAAVFTFLNTARRVYKSHLVPGTQYAPAKIDPRPNLRNTKREMEAL